MMSSSCRHKKDLQPAGALRDGLPPVVRAPALGEGHVHRVLVDGTHVEQRRVDGQLLILAGLLVVEDVQDMSRGKLVHDEICATVDAAVQRRGVHEERDLRPVVQPHAVAVLVKHQTCNDTRPSEGCHGTRGGSSGKGGGLHVHVEAILSDKSSYLFTYAVTPSNCHTRITDDPLPLSLRHNIPREHLPRPIFSLVLLTCSEGEVWLLAAREASDRPSP